MRDRIQYTCIMKPTFWTPIIGTAELFCHIGAKRQVWQAVAFSTAEDDLYTARLDHRRPSSRV